VTPEIQICIITDQKWAEGQNLFKIFNKSAIKIIQDVAQKFYEKALLAGLI